MNRRALLKTVFGASAAIGASASMPVARKYGLVTVDSHRAHKLVTGENLHVFVDGVDVSKSCVEADDINGYVELFCRDRESHADWTKQGAVHVGQNGGVCRLRVTGSIRIEPGADL